LICLGASSLAFGNKGETHEEAMIQVLRQISSSLDQVNAQLHHQTRLIIQLDILVDQILELKKPLDYDWYRENVAKLPAEIPQ